MKKWLIDIVYTVAVLALFTVVDIPAWLFNMGIFALWSLLAIGILSFVAFSLALGVADNDEMKTLKVKMSKTRSAYGIFSTVSNFFLVLFIASQGFFWLAGFYLIFGLLELFVRMNMDDLR